ncbi:MAG: hypothetical protein M3Y59_00615 [Myxococcota bacterium]|nr:hypothetical protein [Myxococcota bacterium]
MGPARFAALLAVVVIACGPATGEPDGGGGDEDGGGTGDAGNGLSCLAGCGQYEWCNPKSGRCEDAYTCNGQICPQ